MYACFAATKHSCFQLPLRSTAYRIYLCFSILIAINRHIKVMRITIREDFSISMADAVLESLYKAIGWLDTHFTFQASELTELAQDALHRKFSRLDSEIVKDLKNIIVKPC
jgi:hypothetical protein